MKIPARLPRLLLASFASAVVLGLPCSRAADAPAPMPVPAVVAIARPSPAEIAQAEASLQKYLAQADPATKEIAAKYPDLIAVRPPRVNPAVVPFLSPNFRAKHAANVEIAKKDDIDLLFMGDSITDFWRDAGRPGVVNPPRSDEIGHACFRVFRLCI